MPACGALTDQPCTTRTKQTLWQITARPQNSLFAFFRLACVCSFSKELHVLSVPHAVLNWSCVLPHTLSSVRMLVADARHSGSGPKRPCIVRSDSSPVQAEAPSPQRSRNDWQPRSVDGQSYQWGKKGHLQGVSLAEAPSKALGETL